MSKEIKKSFEERSDLHLKLLQEIHDTYRKKNSDYGGSFTDLYHKFGLISPVIKLHDKLSRLESLMNKKAEVVDESIEDTLLDLANYAIMTALERRIDNNYYDNVDYDKFDYSKLPKVVAVDFDGTLSVNAIFPEIGDVNKSLVKELVSGKYKDYKKVLYTNRSGKTLENIYPFLNNLITEYGLKFDAINDNIEEVKKYLHGGPIRKIWYDVLIDDKCITPKQLDLENLDVPDFSKKGSVNKNAK